MSDERKSFEINKIANEIKSQHDAQFGFRINELESKGLKDKLARIHFGEFGYYKCAFVDGVDGNGNKINAVVQGSSSAFGDKIQNPMPVFITGGHPVSPDGVVGMMTALGFIGANTSLEIHRPNSPGYLLSPQVERITFQDDPTEVARLRDYALPKHQSLIRACQAKKDLLAWIGKRLPKIVSVVSKVSNTYIGDGILRVIDKLVNGRRGRE